MKKILFVFCLLIGTTIVSNAQTTADRKAAYDVSVANYNNAAVAGANEETVRGLLITAMYDMMAVLTECRERIDAGTLSPAELTKCNRDMATLNTAYGEIKQMTVSPITNKTAIMSKFNHFRSQVF